MRRNTTSPRADLLSRVWTDETLVQGLSPRGWENLIGQARQASLLARLRLDLAERGLLDAVPHAPRQHLDASLALLDRQAHEVRRELYFIGKALRPLNSPVILLKGAAYLLAGLPSAEGRVFSDIDLLVERSQLADAENGLFAAGWISQERDAYNQRYYREWMHEIPPLQHVERGSAIDLHHAITPPTSRFSVDTALLLKAALPVSDSGFHVLGPTDMVLHSATHLYLESEFDRGLRDLLDLRALLRHFSARPDFWTELIGRSETLGLVEPLLHALAQLERLFQLRPPPSVEPELRRVRSEHRVSPVIRGLLRLALRPSHPSCERLASALARGLLYARSHLLRMPMRLLIPHLARKAAMRLRSRDEA